jgi:hypothetical protein
MARFFRPVTKISVSMPAEIASSAAYLMRDFLTTGSNSLGIALVAAKNRVSDPATGNTAFRILLLLIGNIMI